MGRDGRGKLQRGGEVVETALGDRRQRGAVEHRRAAEDVAEDDGGQPVGLDRVGGRQQREPVGDDRGEAVLVAGAPGDERLQRGGGAVTRRRAARGRRRAGRPARLAISTTCPGRGSVRTRPARAAVTCAATSVRRDRPRVGDLRLRVGQRASAQQLGDEHGLAAELHVGGWDHEPVDPAQRAPQLTLGRGLVLEVELVERGLADLAQDGTGVHRAEDLSQRHREHVEQGKVIANRAGQPGPQDLDGDGRAVAHAAVDLGARRDRQRLAVQLVEDLAVRAAPRALEDLLDVFERDRRRGCRPGVLQLGGQPRQRGWDCVGIDQRGGTSECDAAARGAPDERAARLQQ